MKIYVLILVLINSFSFSIFSKQKIENRQEISCQEIEIRHGRLWGNDWHYTINDQKEFRRIIGGKSKIDFTKYTLLGIVTRTGGCQPPNVTNSVYFNKSKNLYEYDLSIRQNGLCKNIFNIERWCLISKISEESRIEFIMK